MFVISFFDSFIYSCYCVFFGLFVRLFIYSFVRSFVRSFARSLTFIHLCIKRGHSATYEPISHSHSHLLNHLINSLCFNSYWLIFAFQCHQYLCFQRNLELVKDDAKSYNKWQWHAFFPIRYRYTVSLAQCC